MSADNWAICPKCKNDVKEIREAFTRKAEAAYGKVTEAQYKSLCDNATKEIKLEETLREDFQIYTNADGEFSVSYGCMCETCGLEFVYNFKQQISL